jgi:hypothetical protein
MNTVLLLPSVSSVVFVINVPFLFLFLMVHETMVFSIVLSHVSD